MNEDIARKLESVKGLAGSGNILAETVKKMSDFLMTMEPGDIVRSDPPLAVAVPLATDLWYLWTHCNLMAKYYVKAKDDYSTPFDGDHFDYRPYMAVNLSFLTVLTGLKPLKICRDLYKQLSVDTYFDVYSMTIKNDWKNDGVYWINTSAFELWHKDKTPQYSSEGSTGYKRSPNDYVGYISFPVGQLGIMETISLMQETDLGGYKLTAIDTSTTLKDKYWPKLPPAFGDFNNPSPDGTPLLQDKDKPSLQSTPEIFPDAKNSNGNQLSGMNYCYGRHMIESAYLMPSTPILSQNTVNSDKTAAYAPTANLDVEIISTPLKQYSEDVKPKMWMRYWIHKDSTLPVPGEFMGILIRPVATPPHVWWFQESSPFVYAGNWMETDKLTSGVVTQVILEANRIDHGIGNQYYVKIQGCEVLITSTDFFTYSKGDRVAIVKLKTTNISNVEVDNLLPATKSFTWLDQEYLKKTDELLEKVNRVIVPMTFYKLKH